MLREKSKWKHHKDLSTNVVHRGGFTRISDEGVERHWSEGVELSVLFVNQLPKVGGNDTPRSRATRYLPKKYQLFLLKGFIRGFT